MFDRRPRSPTAARTFILWICATATCVAILRGRPVHACARRAQFAAHEADVSAPHRMTMIERPPFAPQVTNRWRMLAMRGALPRPSCHSSGAIGSRRRSRTPLWLDACATYITRLARVPFVRLD